MRDRKFIVECVKKSPKNRKIDAFLPFTEVLSLAIIRFYCSALAMNLRTSTFSTQSADSGQWSEATPLWETISSKHNKISQS
jgi:hypothetical protein